MAISSFFVTGNGGSQKLVTLTEIGINQVRVDITGDGKEITAAFFDVIPDTTLFSGSTPNYSVLGNEVPSGGLRLARNGVTAAPNGVNISGESAFDAGVSIQDSGPSFIGTTSFTITGPQIFNLYDLNRFGIRLAGTQGSAKVVGTAATPASASTITGTIFQDQDGDRTFDPGEALSGVTVNLRFDANSNGVFEETDPIIRTATTSNSGLYTFTEVSPFNYTKPLSGAVTTSAARYIVQVVNTNPAFNFVAPVPTAGSNGSGSDVTTNGTFAFGAGVNLQPGQTVQVDAGLVLPSPKLSVVLGYKDGTFNTIGASIPSVDPNKVLYKALLPNLDPQLESSYDWYLDPQPGKTLVQTATITNTGGIANNFSLSLITENSPFVQTQTVTAFFKDGDLASPNFVELGSSNFSVLGGTANSNNQQTFTLNFSNLNFGTNDTLKLEVSSLGKNVDPNDPLQRTPVNATLADGSVGSGAYNLSFNGFSKPSNSDAFTFAQLQSSVLTLDVPDVLGNGDQTRSTTVTRGVINFTGSTTSVFLPLTIDGRADPLIRAKGSGSGSPITPAQVVLPFISGVSIGNYPTLSDRAAYDKFIELVNQGLFDSSVKATNDPKDPSVRGGYTVNGGTVNATGFVTGSTPNSLITRIDFNGTANLWPSFLAGLDPNKIYNVFITSDFGPLPYTSTPSNINAIYLPPDSTQLRFAQINQNGVNVAFPNNLTIYRSTTFGGQQVATGTLGGVSVTTANGTNSITGTPGDDILVGGNGTDTITGGKGNDKLQGNNGSNVFVYAPGDGVDTIANFDSSPIGQDFNNDTLRFVGIQSSEITWINPIGTNNTIVQYRGNDIITLINFVGTPNREFV